MDFATDRLTVEQSDHASCPAPAKNARPLGYEASFGLCHLSLAGVAHRPGPLRCVGVSESQDVDRPMAQY